MIYFDIKYSVDDKKSGKPVGVIYKQNVGGELQCPKDRHTDLVQKVKNCGSNNNKWKYILSSR